MQKEIPHKTGPSNTGIPKALNDDFISERDFPQILDALSFHPSLREQTRGLEPVSDSSSGQLAACIRCLINKEKVCRLSLICRLNAEKNHGVNSVTSKFPAKTA